MIKSINELGSNKSFIRRLLKYYFKDQKFSDHWDGKIDDEVSMSVPDFNVPEKILEFAPGLVLVKEVFRTSYDLKGFFISGYFSIDQYDFKNPKRWNFEGLESYQVKVNKLKQRGIGTFDMTFLGEDYKKIKRLAPKILWPIRQLAWHPQPLALDVEKISRFYFPKKFDVNFFSRFFKVPEPFDYEKLTEAEKKAHDQELKELEEYVNSANYQNFKRHLNG